MTFISVRIDQELYRSAQIEGKANLRSADQQINFWATLGKNVLANLDLPTEFGAQLLTEKDATTTPFNFNK